jgi:glycosyltransferase involved in cell wall biosynthesis
LYDLHKINPIDVVEYTSFAATGLFRRKDIPSIVRISSLQQLLEDGAGNKKMFMLEELENKSLIKADGILGPSQVTAKLIQQKINKEVIVIEWPFTPLNVPEDNILYSDSLLNKKYLLFIGSIGLLKGAKTIAHILPKLFKKYDDLYFVFAGKDDFYKGRPMMNYIWSKAGKYRGRILYLGILPYKQLYPIIRNSEAVVLPSRVDNLPNTLIESMTLGKIVIGTRGASFDQLIEDGKNGFLCNRDDSDGLLAKIEQTINLKPTNKKKIENAAKLRSKDLNVDVIIPRLVHIYNSIIEKSK